MAKKSVTPPVEPAPPAPVENPPVNETPDIQPSEETTNVEGTPESPVVPEEQNEVQSEPGEQPEQSAADPEPEVNETPEESQQPTDPEAEKSPEEETPPAPDTETPPAADPQDPQVPTETPQENQPDPPAPPADQNPPTTPPAERDESLFVHVVDNAVMSLEPHGKEPFFVGLSRPLPIGTKIKSQGKTFVVEYATPEPHKSELDHRKNAYQTMLKLTNKSEKLIDLIDYFAEDAEFDVV